MFGRDANAIGLPVDMCGWRVEMQVSRQFPFLQRANDLHQTGDRSRRLEVADIRLDAAHVQILGATRPAAIHVLERTKLDRIA
nr:hypothetical protein [Burkholderia pyrrocinia]